MEDVSPLLQAAYRHDWDEVERIRIRDGVGDLFEAAAAGDLTAARGLLDTDPGSVERVAGDGFTGLHLAAYFGRDEVVSLLLAAGADPDAMATNGTGLRPLHAATAARAPAIVEMLVEAGATVDARQTGGFTPLMAAAKHGDTTSLRLLLAAGADPSLASDDGATARSMATREAAQDLP